MQKELKCYLQVYFILRVCIILSISDDIVKHERAA